MQKYITPSIIRYQLANLRQLTFEITDACNLRCKYCGYGEFYEDYDKRENKKLSEASALRLLEYLSSFWRSNDNVSSNRNVYISFYGGEPLLNMEFVKNVIAYIEKMNCDTCYFTYSMTTNAMLLDKYMDYLVEKRFNLLISLDGDAEHSAYRVDASGHSAFDRICKNVDLLRVSHPAYFDQYVNFNAVLHTKNSVEGIYRFFKESYDKIPSIGELNDMGIRADKVDEFTRAYKNPTESLMQSEHYQEIERDMFIQAPTYQSVCTFIHQYSDFVFRDYNELLYGKPDTNNWITGTCFPFNKKMFVTVNGKLLPCERIGQQFSLGIVDENEVHLDFEKIAETYNAYFAKLEKQCSHCYAKKSCTQCIFNLNNLDKNPVCHAYMNKEEFDDYVAYNMDFLRQHPKDYHRIMNEIIIG